MNANRSIRTLLFSTLYPSTVRPTHGIFVETRLRHLLQSGQVQTQVIAPVPWFPFSNQRFGEWAKMAATPRHEFRNGIEIRHPRYFIPPKVGMHIAPLMLALGARATVARLIREGFDFDLIDAHYYYPDGVAAALLAKWFHKPVVITARGTDLNLISSYPLPRRMILWAAQQAAASIGVCAALMDVLHNLGVEPSKLHIMRNGVDLERFHPLPPSAARVSLGLPPGILLLSVGHLVELKGHHIAVEILTQLPQAHLVIIGEGKERDRIKEHARVLGVMDRVMLAGAVPNTELARWYSAADILILASSREGWPNVLLESMACGTPVVATCRGGMPEVVCDPVAGRLVKTREGRAFAQAVSALLENYPDRAAVRRYAEGFSWEATTKGQIELFRRISHA
ncbi:MAG: glycosyltransferase family 4 protein [Candidatus Contendobacter sp.]|nr:glycosyltransferase family 4 protein [Candidatus Contendobacter sp.]